MMRKKVSEEEKLYQAQLSQEKELRFMAREFLVLDHDAATRSNYSRDGTLQKVDKVVRLFKKEHLNVLNDLSRATDPGLIREDDKLLDELSSLITEYSLHDVRIKSNKKYMKEIDAEIKLVLKAVHKLQEEQITDRQYEERVINARKTLGALENRLETQMIQFGTICSKNKELRLEIDHLLKSREVFLRLWNDFTHKLFDGKKIMLDLIEQATLAYNQREEWCDKLNLLRIHGLQMVNSNNLEMREHQRTIAKLLKVKNFLSVKGQKRIMYDLEVKEHAKRKLNETKMREKLESYQKMLADIEGFTHQRNIGIIAKNFRRQEEYNISNFKHIIEMIRGCEEITDQLGYLYLDIDERHDIYDTRHLQQQGTLDILSFELEDATAESEVSRQQLNETNSIFDELLKGTDRLFTICKCDKDPLFSLLDDNRKIKYYNVKLYLGVLERRIQEILVGAGDIDKARKPGDDKRLIDTSREIARIYQIEDIVQATPCSLCVEHEMVSDVIDILQHVFSKREARSTLRKCLKLPGSNAKLHSISHCQLPKARGIMQRRYE